MSSPLPAAQPHGAHSLAASSHLPNVSFSISSDHPTVHTKLLSPFNEEVDETPIIRSVMLKLLLKYR